LDAPVAAALLPSLARFTAAATGVTGPASVRERLELADAPGFDPGEAVMLGRDIDMLAGLLASRVR
jgi:hypothetical protein